MQTGEPTSEPTLKGDSGASNVFGPGFFIPLPVDLALHLAPLLILSLHFFVLEEKYGRQAKRVWAPLLTGLFTLWYSGFQEWCASYNGYYSYPFLDAPVPVRLGIYFGAMALAFGSFRALNGMHRATAIMPSVYSVPKQV